MPPVIKKSKDETPDLEIIYPEEEAKLFKGDKAITFDQMREILGWETEEQYKERIKREKGEAAKEYKVGFGDEYMLKDPNGKKIRCSHNSKNRPFKEPWAKALCQDILLSGPGLPLAKRRFRFNGEALILGRYGSVISGQHRGAGFMLAVLEWRKDPARWKFSWPTEPVFETVATLGISEDQDTIRTIDNVQPRSLSDVLFTSDVFAKITNSVRRKEVTGYLAKAVDLLWKRVNIQTRYQTTAESCDFLDRHKNLLKCVKHVFDENGGGEKAGRALSALSISPGEVAALMYLMACSKSSPEEYEKTWSEKGLNFTLMEKAEQFVSRLALGNEGAPDFEPLRKVLGQIVTDEDGATSTEKRALLANAWNLFVQDKPITEAGIALKYGEDEAGVKRLIEFPSVGGIDKGDHVEKKQAGPTKEELEAEKARIRKETADKLLERIKQNAAARGQENGQVAPPAPAPTPATTPTPPPKAPVKPRAKPQGKPVLRGGTEK